MTDSSLDVETTLCLLEQVDEGVACIPPPGQNKGNLPCVTRGVTRGATRKEISRERQAWCGHTDMWNLKELNTQKHRSLLAARRGHGDREFWGRLRGLWTAVKHMASYTCEQLSQWIWKVRRWLCQPTWTREHFSAHTRIAMLCAFSSMSDVTHILTKLTKHTPE